MYVKFLKTVESSIGHFYVDEIHFIEDENVVQNWLDQELIIVAQEHPDPYHDETKPVRQRRTNLT